MTTDGIPSASPGGPEPLRAPDGVDAATWKELRDALLEAADEARPIGANRPRGGESDPADWESRQAAVMLQLALIVARGVPIIMRAQTQGETRAAAPTVDELLRMFQSPQHTRSGHADAGPPDTTSSAEPPARPLATESHRPTDTVAESPPGSRPLEEILTDPNLAPTTWVGQAVRFRFFYRQWKALRAQNVSYGQGVRAICTHAFGEGLMNVSTALVLQRMFGLDVLWGLVLQVALEVLNPLTYAFTAALKAPQQDIERKRKVQDVVDASGLQEHVRNFRKTIHMDVARAALVGASVIAALNIATVGVAAVAIPLMIAMGFSTYSDGSKWAAWGCLRWNLGNARQRQQAVDIQTSAHSCEMIVASAARIAPHFVGAITIAHLLEGSAAMKLGFGMGGLIVGAGIAVASKIRLLRIAEIREFARGLAWMGRRRS